ncbi:STY4851/ECs_5259 family protein [Methyloglobulus sp.]|uniref:STY4851/ECs_5259 family protein n=1 Tax=Methyloglobulus sp. TaxID=2518622 RepID=UPI00398A2338
MLPKDWLKQFLASRHIASPDGRPLYRYRLGDSEFEALKSALKTSALFGVANITEVTGWNDAFVIYAAEWWRRDYDGSSWSWGKVFSSFGADAKALTPTRRNLLVESGLRYWRREVRIINGSSRYLGSIAIEGGLPLNQLNKSSGWLGKVFKQVIPKYTRLQNTGIHADTLIGECDYIPKTYQNPEIRAILGDMVQAVVELKQQYRLHERSKPVSYLDQQAPSWRERFPLPIETEVGQKLLSDMIITAAKADDAAMNLPFLGIRCVRDDGSLQLQLEFAGFIALEKLNLPETIPSRLDVELVSSEGVIRSLGVALKTTYQQKSSLKMPRPPGAIKGDQAAHGYAIRFKHLSTLICEIPLTGGEELENEVPWIFAQQNDDWVLEGIASVSTRAKQVRILYPAYLVYLENNDIREMAPVANKKQLEASGIIQLTDHENSSFIIKTAQEHSANCYSLQGRTLEFASTPKEAYRGLPFLTCVNNETEKRTKIPATKLVARAVNAKGDWQPLTQVQQGIYKIRLHDPQGNIQFRKKCALLPEQFAVRFKPSVDSLDGTIYLDNTGHAKVSCEPSVKHSITAEAGGGGHRVELVADNAPPSHVRLTLCWPGMTDMLTLTVPFPARGGQIIDANGYKQSSKQPLFQDQLHGFRLRLFNEQPDRNRHLQIDFNLKDDTLDNTRDLYFRHEVEKKGAVIELAIIDYQDWIKTLLAISTNLDSYVSLAVYENGSELLRTEIFRYQFSLERNLSLGCVALNINDHACLPYDTLAQIQLMAMRLSQPEQEHDKLDAQSSGQTVTSCWFFYPEKRVASPWLIYPSAKSSVSLRPILWFVGYELGAESLAESDISTLHSAVSLSPTQLKNQAIKTILERMCTDFDHSGWAYLKHLWKQCTHLPLASFDVWSIAVTDTKLLAAMVLQMDESFTRKFSEELPIFWELIPLNDWLAVFKNYSDYLKQAMSDETDVFTILETRIKRISQLCKSMEIVSRILERRLLNIPHPHLGFDLVKNQISQYLQELIRRQSYNNWPQDLKKELITHWRDMDKSQQLGINLKDISEHQHSVIILPMLLAAFCSNSNITETWAGNASVIFKLNRLKDFDEAWLNDVFFFAVAYFSQQPAD